MRFFLIPNLVCQYDRVTLKIAYRMKKKSRHMKILSSHMIIVIDKGQSWSGSSIYNKQKKNEETKKKKEFITTI
ncbi:hypothetical protein RIR_jg33446.t1 [Rhizophagus irregularis DAOM 181602=DAOM 197198]|nr:hypothetical protein RIR_jg33446.t1 [Rhizophagus irregularis DAOM 181602=DAOM 197198]